MHQSVDLQLRFVKGMLRRRYHIAIDDVTNPGIEADLQKTERYAYFEKVDGIECLADILTFFKFKRITLKSVKKYFPIVLLLLLQNTKEQIALPAFESFEVFWIFYLLYITTQKSWFMNYKFYIVGFEKYIPEVHEDIIS